MADLVWQVPVGLFLVWLTARAWRRAAERPPGRADRILRNAYDRRHTDATPESPHSARPQFVVACRLLGGMADGEEVEVPSQLWLAAPPTELWVIATDRVVTPPQVHRLRYRVTPEDPQVFTFAGMVPAPHEMMGDD